MTRVLIVDDNPEIRMILVSALQRNGYEVIDAANGESVQALVEELEPTVIIIDIMMPGIDGWQTLDLLKSNPKSSWIPVIISSALSEPEHLAMARKSGAVDYLPKPWSKEELLMRVQWAATVEEQAA